MQLAHGKALGWEMWRRGWLWFLVAVFAPSTFFLLLILSGPHENDPRSIAFMNDVYTHTFPILLLVEMGMFIAMIAQAQGDDFREVIARRCYHLPIPTATLVAWRVVLCSGLVAVLHLGVVLMLGISIEIWMPIVIPILFLILAAVAIQALLLIFTGHLFLQVASGFVFGLTVFFWLHQAFKPTPAGVAWPDIGFGQSLALCGLIGVSWVLATIGAARERRGDAEGWVGLREWWDGMMLRLRTRREKFESAKAAQFWFERRTRGGSYACIIMLPAVMSVVSLCIGARTRDVLEVSFGMSLFVMLGAAFPIGLLIGHSGKLKGNLNMETFRATRPLTDKSMAWEFLHSAVHEIKHSWLGLALLLGSVHLVLVGMGETDAIATFWNHIFRNFTLPLWLDLPLFVIGFFVLQWALLCLGISFALTGRAEFIVTFIAVAMISFFLIPFTHHQPGLEWIRSVLGAVGVAALVIGQGVLLTGWRRGYVKGWVAAMPIVVGAAAFGLHFVLGARSVEVDLMMLVAFGSLIGALPFAAAPLALAYNRHR